MHVKNPDRWVCFRAWAHQFINYRIRLGLLIRPTKCKKCKKECKTQAHHKDYTKPSEVIWLCRSCHTKLHYKINGSH